MLARALDAKVPVAWVTADAVYGGDGRLRRWLEERDVAHVLAVNCNQSLVSGLVRFERADQLAARIPAGAWRHLSAGQGAKGERLYAWARVAIRPLREPGRGHWLLVRRSLADGELAYYVCYGPAETSLAELVPVAGVRWTVECGFQQGKGETGLDHYQVRRSQAWYRHVTLSMLAQAFLAVQRGPRRGRHGGRLSAQNWSSRWWRSACPRSAGCCACWSGRRRPSRRGCLTGPGGVGVIRRVLVAVTGRVVNDGEKCGCSIKGPQVRPPAQPPPGRAPGGGAKFESPYPTSPLDARAAITWRVRQLSAPAPPATLGTQSPCPIVEQGYEAAPRRQHATRGAARAGRLGARWLHPSNPQPAK
jgi:DDE family transposase